MASASNALGTVPTQGVQGLHYDVVKNVGLSGDVEKPALAELCSFGTLPSIKLDEDYKNIASRFHFASPARTYPIVYNSESGMVVGRRENGDAVWAHIHPRYGNKVLCDRPRRAFVLFQSVSRGGDVHCLSSLEQVYEWDMYIAGECEGLVQRWCFVYDALVQELKAEVE